MILCLRLSSTTAVGISYCLFESYQMFPFLLNVLQGMQTIHSSLSRAKIAIKYQ